VTLAFGRLIGVLLCAAALFSCADPAEARVAVPPAPTRWVTDNAGFLSTSTRDSLDAEMQAYEQRTGHQVIVYIGTTTGDVPLEEYTVNAFAAWKVGRKGLDDGLVLFIFAKDHNVRIEVGYGLEPVVTDAASAEIIRNIIVPDIRAGDNDAAVTDGVAQLLATIDGSPAPESSGGNAGITGAGAPPSESDQPSLGSLIFIGIALILFVILFIRSPTFALWLLFSLLSGGRGGGGYSGGGGSFSGGGGRSGGGGASGSW
jgi:uncharacterized protein